MSGTAPGATTATASDWPRAPQRRVWAGYAAAGWAGLFAVRGVYWALGGTLGLGTLSQGIKDLHAAGDPELYAALWMTVALEVFGIGLALALVCWWGETFPSWVPLLRRQRIAPALLTLPAWGASGLLVGHGGMFMSFGARSAFADRPWTPEVAWYSLFTMVRHRRRAVRRGCLVPPAPGVRARHPKSAVRCDRECPRLVRWPARRGGTLDRVGSCLLTS